MTNFKTLETAGWKSALYGMRMPLKSYNRADSYYEDNKMAIGPNDYDLAKRLWKAGTEHRKYLRMIEVWVEITAPRFFFQEWDTYKVGTSANSESTMHKILTEKFDVSDFEWPELNSEDKDFEIAFENYLEVLKMIRDRANQETDKHYKETLHQTLKAMLPESFIQKRTVCVNYETLATMYRQRKHHRLPQWRVDFCEWVKTLPYSELITGEFDTDIDA